MASGALSLPGPVSETGNRRPETDLLVGAGRRSPEWAGANLRVSGGPNDLACSRRANVNIGGCKARATSSRDLCAAQPGSSSPNSTAPNRAGTFHSVQFHPPYSPAHLRVTALFVPAKCTASLILPSTPQHGRSLGDSSCMPDSDSSTLALHETRQRPAASAVVMLQYQQQFESRFLIRVHLCPSVAPFFGLAECSEGG